MKKLNIIGNYFGSDGYSSHTRQLANALNKLDNIEISMSTGKPHDWVRWVNDNELEMLKRNSEDCDINLMIAQPHFWTTHLCEDKPFIGFLVFEGDKIPKAWIEILVDERVTQVWVASNHTKNAIVNTVESLIPGICEENHDNIYGKIRIVPHGVDLNIFKPEKKEHSKFRFLANKGYRGERDRGGLQYLFKAFNEEFAKDEEVELLVKINASYGVVDFGEELKKLGLVENRANISINTENIEYKKLKDFYNEGDVFVTTSQAEAFNLPCIEAMACSLPVIATTFGGQSDFVNEENGWLLEEGTMKEVKWDVEYESISWKEPSIPEIRKVLREVFEIYNDTEQPWIKRGGNQYWCLEKRDLALNTAKEYTWDNSAEKAKKFLDEIK
ncbi:glycosyltransferase [Candidatus Pacearchaeota archaeon]|nr:glycosyltransferase [Candidatus Pacearchaeota archaeon]